MILSSHLALTTTILASLPDSVQVPTTPLAVRAARGGGGLCTPYLRGSPCAQYGVGNPSNNQGVIATTCSMIGP